MKPYNLIKRLNIFGDIRFRDVEPKSGEPIWKPEPDYRGPILPVMENPENEFPHKIILKGGSIIDLEKLSSLDDFNLEDYEEPYDAKYSSGIEIKDELEYQPVKIIKKKSRPEVIADARAKIVGRYFAEYKNKVQSR